MDSHLTKSDRLVLRNLASDLPDERALAELGAMNDPGSSAFEPTVFVSADLSDLRLPAAVDRWLLRPYIAAARRVVRHETDVVLLTHLLLYLTTSVPSAALLFRRFTWPHAAAHLAMQLYYVGSYTLMMHQHIHQRGVLARPLGWLDAAFPYVTDPLMGHTWNSYYYHHVKHHHVEANGPDDLSSTIRYQRDSAWHFAHYVGRFYFLVWLDLPLYFVRKRKIGLAARAAGWEMASYAAMAALVRYADARAALMVFIMPFLILRVGLMAGNWGQHAFVDEDDPASDYRSSITLIDVSSNRYCFNDGYHTSHHLNPLRHWRDHPAAFVKAKETYAAQRALVFQNIDFLMITIRLLMKDYMHLARCLVPIGDQVDMTLEERAAMLQRHARRFTDEEIEQKFKKAKAG